jgi:pimeloyl-ACP methyl ester carboxylesterase
MKTGLHKWGKLAVLALVLNSSITLAIAQQAAASREFFYVGGKYTKTADGELMAGQMYVEVLRPPRVTQQYPIVFFHGGSETGTIWMSTPDGRMGWADYFVAQGYVVYLVDQPARGRSAWHASTNGPRRMRITGADAERMIAIEDYGAWPQAKKHTQWPGKSRMGDPVFDNFYASLVEQLTSIVEIQTLGQAAGAALLDKIGPAIILTHSQSGPVGWLIADQRPKSVKGIVAVEPSGPPFGNLNDAPSRFWGLTDIPLTYLPPLAAATDLAKELERGADRPNLAACWKQASPARQLVNLKSVPVLVMTTEASYHTVYDHCTAKYLTQAGVQTTFMRLEEHGIHGNGHHVMLEKNNLEVAALLHKWILAYIK